MSGKLSLKFCCSKGTVVASLNTAIEYLSLIAAGDCNCCITNSLQHCFENKISKIKKEEDIMNTFTAVVRDNLEFLDGTSGLKVIRI